MLSGSGKIDTISCASVRGPIESFIKRCSKTFYECNRRIRQSEAAQRKHTQNKPLPCSPPDPETAPHLLVSRPQIQSSSSKLPFLLFPSNKLGCIELAGKPLPGDTHDVDHEINKQSNECFGRGYHIFPSSSSDDDVHAKCGLCWVL